MEKKRQTVFLSQCEGKRVRVSGRECGRERERERERE